MVDSERSLRPHTVDQVQAMINIPAAEVIRGAGQGTRVVQAATGPTAVPMRPSQSARAQKYTIPEENIT